MRIAISINPDSALNEWLIFSRCWFEMGVARFITYSL